MRAKFGMIVYLLLSATGLLYLFPDFRKDMTRVWEVMRYSGGYSVDMPSVTPADALPYVIMICGLGTAMLLFWHQRPN